MARRRALRLSRAQVARVLEVGEPAVGEIERGAHLPNQRHLEALARALGCDVRDLFDPGPPARPSTIARVVALVEAETASDPGFPRAALRALRALAQRRK